MTGRLVRIARSHAGIIERTVVEMPDAPPTAPAVPRPMRGPAKPLSITAERDAVVARLTAKALLFEEEMKTHDSGPVREAFAVLAAGFAAEALAISRGEHRKR